MNYTQYQLIIDLLDEQKHTIDENYRIAYSLGAKSDDIWEETQKRKLVIIKTKQALKECVQEWVKNKYPDNEELLNFWNC